MLFSHSKTNERANPKPGIFTTSLLAASMLISLTACGSNSPASTPTLDAENTPIPTLATRTSPPIIDSYGQLDPTFGDGGMVTTELGSTLDEIRGIVIQPDGKIVAAGESWPKPGAQPRFTLARYTPGGKLDTTFGDEGIVYTNIGGRAHANAIALQPDGKFVVVGQGKNEDLWHPVFAMARYNKDGSLDKAFGDEGTVTTEFIARPEESEALGVAIAPDGKIVAVGSVGPYIFSHDIVAARYNKDGSPDKTFGNKGQFYYNHPEGEAIARSVLVRPDGGLYLGGNISVGSGDDNFAVLSVTAKGKLDTSFGVDGIAEGEMLGGTDWAYDAAFAEDGKILLGGLAQVYCPSWGCEKYGFALAQFNPDGTPDSDFGDEGVIWYDFISPTAAYAMARRDDGLIAVAGSFGNDEFAVALFNPNGTLDTSIGDEGLIRTDFGPAADRVHALAFQEDGNLVAAGRVVTNPEELLEGDFGLARYIMPPR